MDDLTSRLRSAYDTLMDRQPDPPLFEEVAVPTLVDRPPGRIRKPLVAFASGIAAVAVLTLILWVSGAWSDRLPPSLEGAQGTDLDWRATEGLDPHLDRVVFASGEGETLAVATSWTQGVGTRLSGIYRSEEGVRWTEVESDGLDGLDQLLMMTDYPDGYLVSGLHRRADVAQPALWTSASGESWDLTLLPIPQREDPGDIVSYGVGPVAFDADQAVALGQFVQLGSEDPDAAEPTFNDEGDLTPVDQGTFLWETDESGAWIVSESAPEDPLFVTDGPAGVVLLSSGAEETTEVWHYVDGEWIRSATFEVPGQVGAGIRSNDNGYLLVLLDGSVWFSADATAWQPVEDLTLGPIIGASSGAVYEAGPGGFVVATIEEGVSSQLWWSGDGTEWAEVPIADLGVADVESISSGTVTERAITLAGLRQGGESQGFVLTGTALTVTPTP